MQEFKFKGKVVTDPIDENNVAWLIEDSFGVRHNAADLLTGIDLLSNSFRTEDGDEVEIIVHKKVIK
jgi:hypothetical protein